MFDTDVGLTDTVIHALDECEERNLKDLNRDGNKWKCYTKSFLHGAAIGIMDLMMIFGAVLTVAGLIMGRKGKALGFVDK